MAYAARLRVSEARSRRETESEEGAANREVSIVACDRPETG